MSPDDPTQAGPSLSIVALDDDDDFRQYIRQVLEADGHAVRCAATPEAFYAACEESLPDLVLLDIKMGRHSGEEVLAEVRKRWPKLGVIVVTGYPSLDSMRLTFKQDVFDYLAKPFSTDELRRCLAQAASTLGLGQRPLDRLRASLGRQIRVSRTEKGWTLRDLSEASGVSVSQLSSIERGAHLPSLESLVGIAQALGQRPGEWLTGSGF
ncbi:MAG: response regulator [Phycisphaeraceae bacterium]|nr:MAG: response regulator [Phycisphaeraceae bacterium]